MNVIEWLNNGYIVECEVLYSPRQFKLLDGSVYSSKDGMITWKVSDSLPLNVNYRILKCYQ